MEAIKFVTTDMHTFEDLVFPGRERASISLKLGSHEFSRVICPQGSSWSINGVSVEKAEYIYRLQSDVNIPFNNVKSLTITKSDLYCVMNGTQQELALLVDQIISHEEYTYLKHVSKGKPTLILKKLDFIRDMIEVKLRQIAMTKSCNFAELKAELLKQMTIWYKSELFKSKSLASEEKSKLVSESGTSTEPLVAQYQDDIKSLIQDITNVNLRNFIDELEILRRGKEKESLVERIDNAKERLQKIQNEKVQLLKYQEIAPSETRETWFPNPFLELDSPTHFLESGQFSIHNWKEDIDLLKIRELKLKIQNEQCYSRINKITKTVEGYNTQLTQVEEEIATHALVENNNRDMKLKMRELMSRSRSLETKIEYAEKEKASTSKRLSDGDAELKSCQTEITDVEHKVKQEETLKSVEKSLDENLVTILKGSSVFDVVQNVKKQLQDVFKGLLNSRHTRWLEKIVGEFDEYILNLQSSLSDFEENEQNYEISINEAVDRIKTSEEKLSSLKSKLQKFNRNIEYLPESLEISKPKNVHERDCEDIIQLSHRHEISLSHDDAEESDQERGVLIDNISKITEKVAEAKIYLDAQSEHDSLTQEQTSLGGDLEIEERKLDQAEDAMNKRLELFTEAFNYISENIDKNYKSLTRSVKYPEGGSARVSLKKGDELLPSITYTANPPTKSHVWGREQLSPQEKTIAALAFLFTVRSFKPQSPLLILEEVDEELDEDTAVNVAEYLSSLSRQMICQSMVLSRNTSLFSNASNLVSAYKLDGIGKAARLSLNKYKESSAPPARPSSSLSATTSQSPFPLLDPQDDIDLRRFKDFYESPAGGCYLSLYDTSYVYTKDFWQQLVGDERFVGDDERGWLVDPHLDNWCHYLYKYRSNTARWSALSSWMLTFFDNENKS